MLMQSPTEKRVLDEVWPIIEQMEKDRADRLALEGLKKVRTQTTPEQTFEDSPAQEAEE